jgi:hypothetical protein
MKTSSLLFFCIFFGRLECVDHSLAYVAYLVFLKDVWIRTQRAAVASSLSHLYLPVIVITLQAEKAVNKRELNAKPMQKRHKKFLPLFVM